MTTDEAWLCEVHRAVSDAALDTLFRQAHTTRNERLAFNEARQII